MCCCRSPITVVSQAEHASPVLLLPSCCSLPIPSCHTARQGQLGPKRMTRKRDQNGRKNKTSMYASTFCYMQIKGTREDYWPCQWGKCPLLNRAEFVIDASWHHNHRHIWTVTCSPTAKAQPKAETEMHRQL